MDLVKLDLIFCLFCSDLPSAIPAIMHRNQSIVFYHSLITNLEVIVYGFLFLNALLLPE